MTGIDKRICVETRTSNSRRLHFNRVGDWRPRLIVWPEYNGCYKDEFDKVLGNDVDMAWGRIIAGTLDSFAREYDLTFITYQLQSPGFWERLRHENVKPTWKRNNALSPDVEYVNWCQHEFLGEHKFLATPRRIAESAPMEIRGSVVDRANLLPFGIAIFDFGIEEAVMQITFLEGEDRFRELLEQVAAEHDHRATPTDSHFISHWLIANKEAQVADWDKF